MTTKKKTLKRLKLTGAELDRAYNWYAEQSDAVKSAITSKIEISAPDSGEAFTDKWLNADIAEAIRAAVDAVGGVAPDVAADDVAAHICVKADRVAAVLDYLYFNKLEEAAPETAEQSSDDEIVQPATVAADEIAACTGDGSDVVGAQSDEVVITPEAIREILDANMAKDSLDVAVDEIISVVYDAGPQPTPVVESLPLVWNPVANSIFVTLPAGVIATRAWLAATDTNRMVWRTPGGGSTYRIPLSVRAIMGILGRSKSFVFGITQPDGSSRKWQIHNPTARLELR
jgi:hypothetical protein